MNEFVKRIIMEQIYSSEVLDGYKIDDKDSFCEEILSQIPEENHEAISNDEMSDYLVQLIKDTYNRNVVANKIFEQVEKSIKLKDKNKLVERMDVYSLVVSKISTDHYERIAKNKMDDELEKIVESSVDDVIKNEITEKKLNRVLFIFTDDKEKFNMSDADVLVNKKMFVRQIEKMLVENSEKDKVYSENMRKSFELKGREQTDPVFRQQGIRQYIRDKLMSFQFTFYDLDQEVDKIVNKYFTNDMSYFNLINGEYDDSIYDMVLIDSLEYKNIREIVINDFKSREKYYKNVTDDAKNAAIFMATSALCSMAKSSNDRISKNEKIDVYVYEQLYYDNDSMNNYKRLLGSTIDVFLKNETKPFKEIMNELREKVSDVDWKSIITLTSLLTFGAATDFAIAAVVGSIAFLRKLNRELKEYREQLKKEKVFLEEKNGTEIEDQESDMVL